MIPAIAPRRHTRRNLFALAALAIFALSSCYAALAMVTQVDQFFLPGSELHIRGPFGLLPFSPPGLDLSDPSAIDAEDQRINILLVGLDKRPQEDANEAYRADSIMVITIHPYAKRASILGFPRD